MRYRIEFSIEATPEQAQQIREQITHSRVWYDRLARFFRDQFGVEVGIATGTFRWSNDPLASARERSLQ